MSAFLYETISVLISDVQTIEKIGDENVQNNDHKVCSE